MTDQYLLLKYTLGVLATIGLYSILYRETKLYRFFEHMFLGLAAGYAIVALWKETLKSTWWDKMTGIQSIDPETGVATVQNLGYWVYMLLLPIGLMGYFVFSKKHNWMSRIPIGVILGFWSGQQVMVWWTRWGPQINSSMQSFIPTTTDRFTVPATSTMTPEAAAEVAGNIYPSQALSNLVFVVTILAALSYFFFSFDVKGRFMKGMNTLGRWLLMVGFGAIFGATVMARFALEIDRMAYVWLEWLTQVRIVLGGG
jgi:hypothetical protein